jgi:hypothetical protein
MHSCEKIKRRLAGDDGFRRQIESLTQAIAS